MTYWSVPRDWRGETAFIVAGGPSLRGFDWSRLAGKRTIVVNDPATYPDADMLYAADDRHGPRAALGALGSRPDQVNVCSCDGFEHPSWKTVKHTGLYGIDCWAYGVRMGGSSLHGAINIAVHKGAARQVLLGADMKVAADGATHWNGMRNRRYVEDPGIFARSFIPSLLTTVQPLRDLGIEVLNACPDSALTCWPRISHAEALAP